MPDKRRNSPPLDQIRLEQLALAYVARMATTQAKLRFYLQRKLRDRGWDADTPPDLEALISRYAHKGYVDDEAWAKMKTGSLLRRGYGARRVGESLGHAGIGEDIRHETKPSVAAQRRAAVTLAQRRKFGPFGALHALGGNEDGRYDFAEGDSWSDSRSDLAKLKEKQMSAMLRAGHPLDIVRYIVESTDAETLEEWCESAIGDL